MLTDRELALVKHATAVMTSTERDENHTVAAAAYDSVGNVFTGVNVFHFTGGPCAESVVMGQAAASSDARLPLTIIVTVIDRGCVVIPPCGRCRQMLFDYYPDVLVIVRGKNGLESIPIADLLPYAFVWHAYVPDAAGPILYMYDGYLDAIRDGSKRSTVRVRDPASPGPIRLVFEHDDNTSTTIHALVTHVESKAVIDLDDEDAVRDGFADRRALLDALEFHYPGLEESAEVEIVHFRTTV